MKYLILGATGMAGHMISLYLCEKGHDVTAYSRRPFKYCKNIQGNAFDIIELQKMIKEGNFDVIVNCLGLLNQNADNKKDQAVFINSYIPHLLESITLELKTKVIHLSTDCVFSGKIGFYNEDTFQDGVSFYDRTKALGEINNSKDLTFRNSIIGPDMNESGIGLFNWFMKQSGEINGYLNAYWNGVTTLELAKAIEIATKQKLSGIYHLIPEENINKFDLLQLFKKHTNKNIIINPYNNKYINKTLVNNRHDFNYQVQNYDEMIKELMIWVNKHQNLYPHYFQNSQNE